MNEEWKDYYLILELEFGATDEEIQKQYRTLVKKYHPDSPEADEVKIRDINDAYSVLRDPDKRKKYDETYEQCKMGNKEEFTESEDEMPKYTHEEMHETFTEEEIRFAEKIALQKVINETLEKAKIIIDAKNELLFMAFMDTYDEEGYIYEYNEFLTISKEYLSNLENLIIEAHKYELDDEVKGIKEVINFINECIEEIPKTLNGAKRFVKKELMREQLKEETEEELSNAELNKNNFITFYRQVYEQNIDSGTFESNYNIYYLHITDSISKLRNIYDLLKEAKLDEEYKQVGLMIGSLTEYLKLYIKDYSIALKIGKKESVKAKIKLNVLAFDEYKTKIRDIFKVIYSNPLSTDLDKEIIKAKSLGVEFRDKFISIDINDLDNLYFYNEADELFKKAFLLFQNSEDIKNKIHSIFKENGAFFIKMEKIPELVLNIETLFDDKEALKLLKQVYILLGRSDAYIKLCHDNIQNEIDRINTFSDKTLEVENILEEMYEYIENLKSQYQAIGGDDFANNYLKKYQKLLDFKDSNSDKAYILKNIGGIGLIIGFINLFISKDSSTTLGIFILSVFSIIFSSIPKYKTTYYSSKIEKFQEKLKILELYNGLLNGANEEFNYLYSKGLYL